MSVRYGGMFTRTTELEGSRTVTPFTLKFDVGQVAASVISGGHTSLSPLERVYNPVHRIYAGQATVKLRHMDKDYADALYGALLLKPVSDETDNELYTVDFWADWFTHEVSYTGVKLRRRDCYDLTWLTAHAGSYYTTLRPEWRLDPLPAWVGELSDRLTIECSARGWRRTI